MVAQAPVPPPVEASDGVAALTPTASNAAQPAKSGYLLILRIIHAPVR